MISNDEIVAIAENLEDWVRRGRAHKLLPSEAEPLRRIAALAEECAELAEKAEQARPLAPRTAAALEMAYLGAGEMPPEDVAYYAAKTEPFEA